MVMLGGTTDDETEVEINWFIILFSTSGSSSVPHRQVGLQFFCATPFLVLECGIFLVAFCFVATVLASVTASTAGPTIPVVDSLS